MLLLLLLACPTPKDSAEPEAVDSDGDGYFADDCDDADATVHPAADEHCDGRDEDCSGVIDDYAMDRVNYYVDGDGDGYGVSGTSVYGCMPSGATLEIGDCDDADSRAHPGATEGCTDLVDLNCDGITTGIDQDGDGYAACQDCDEADADIHPGAVERCDPDNADEDCDTLHDDADSADPGTMSTFYADVDGDGHGDPAAPTQACDLPPGFVDSADDCDDTDAARFPAATEHCDGVDEDCDTLVDDADPDLLADTPWYADADGDGFGNVRDAVLACVAPAGRVADASDCRDDEADVHPGADEVCDYLDNDCDGFTDDDDIVSGPMSTWYDDDDGDLYGDPDNTVEACAPPLGFVGNGDDCDDSSALATPDGVEVCDDLDIDEDCDGYVDDEDPSATGYNELFVDADLDSYGSSTPSRRGCDAMPGEATHRGDCDDTRADINPDAAEVCDPEDIDEDCNGDVDDADRFVTGTQLWYPDHDGDGYGSNEFAPESRCDAQEGEAGNYFDCDDFEPDAHQGALEICDGIDNDCDGYVDTLDSDITEIPTWYRDYDGDGYGDPTSPLEVCDAPLGYVLVAEDCDDRDATRHPAATETAEDGVDNDCDGLD